MVTYDAEADVLYVRLSDEDVVVTESIDDLRLVDFSADRGVVGVEFIDATAGIDLRDVPFRQKIERMIGESGLSIRILA